MRQFLQVVATGPAYAVPPTARAGIPRILQRSCLHVLWQVQHSQN
jgi:hypothetical protein